MLKKFGIVIMSLAVFMACGDDDTEEVLIDTSMPQGAFTATTDGTFVEQNDTGSTGTAELGTDENGTQFLRFGSDFSTTLATGTVTVYLSTSSEYKADPGSGNPDLRLIGPVSSTGENFFKLEPAAASKFTHVILWCGSANIPFGYAELN
ncbi:DM13 domain-containing protein [Fulvivirga ulvae]|uniref:DM13 domain-containing protein n=1 Tax=Fulvivirga ulvae TaxID=2904245 RepID=UPI001F269900|nr:DM13 domain-containing protein [Fulvivirga ulvae]UII34155.1 DM13 domain-containing protein [Fulvivirga ulvae]